MPELPEVETVSYTHLGLAAQETIKVLHSPRFMREPLATEGSIEGLSLIHI